jgi:serine/threonine-protein kinase
MKLIEGTSLDHFLAGKEHKRLEIREAIPIAGDILRALDYAHQHAIFHRDVKPSNVLLDKDNRALLIDFGIALAVGEDRRTRTGQTLGTPLYMSPEQITKPKEITYLSDVYSMGCVLYEMLTGRPPFVSGEDGIEHADFALQEAHVKIRPINPQIRVSTIPDNLDRLIMAALEKDPNERIGGCGEFLRLLEKGDGPPNDEPRPWPKFVWVFGLVILLLGLILVFSQ